MTHPFLEWNARLLAEFFSPANSGEVVVLAVGPDELADLGPDLGGYEGLLSAVRAGVPWCTGRVLSAQQFGNRFTDPVFRVGCDGSTISACPSARPILSASAADFSAA